MTKVWLTESDLLAMTGGKVILCAECPCCPLCACWDPQGAAGSNQPDTIAQYVLAEDGTAQVGRGTGHVHASSWDFPGTAEPNEEWLKLATADWNVFKFTDDDFTVALWVKLDIDAAAHFFLSIGEDSTNTPFFEIQRTTSRHPSNPREIEVYVNGTATNSSQTIATGGWHHVVVRWNESTQTITISVDGSHNTAASMSAAMGSSTNADMWVGNSIARSGGQMNGEMDALKIWCYRITDAEVVADYNAGAGVACCGDYA